MGLELAGVVVGAIVLLSIVKPWAWGAPAASVPPLPRPRPVASSPAPARTSDVSPFGLAATVCLGTDAWRVASVETWQLIVAGRPETQQVRVWRAVSPIGFAHGPLDPAIPMVVVAATEVDTLGWCAPGTGLDAPVGPVAVTAWRLAEDGSSARPVLIRRVAPIGGDSPYAALYREVTDCIVGFGCSGGGVPLLSSTWAAGAYVFHYVSGDGRGWWFGAEVQVLPQPTPAP